MVTYFNLPSGGPGGQWNAVDIATGPDRKLWYTTTTIDPFRPHPAAVGNLTPPKFACLVPRLRAKTLLQARRLAHRAGCQLAYAPPRKGARCSHQDQLVVLRQQPSPGSKELGLTSVTVRLTCPSSHRKHPGRH